jgi:MFS family permease
MAETSSSLRVRSRLPSFRALKHPNFRLFWLTGLFLSAGQGMLLFTIAWLSLDLTGSVSQLGIIIFFAGIPRLVFFLIGGVMADRIDRLKLIRTSEFILLTYALVLGVMRSFGLVEVWQLYLGSLIVGSVQSFNTPSLVSIVRDLVSKEDIMNAIVINSMIMNTVFLVGPTLSGFLIAIFGIAPTLFVVSCCFAVSMLPLSFIHIQSDQPARAPTSIGSDLMEGVRFVRLSPLAIVLVITGVAWGFLGQASVQLLPGFGREVLELGPTRTGLLGLALGIGSLLGNLTLSALTDFRNKNWLLMFGITLFPTGLLLLSQAPVFGLALICLPLIGYGSILYVSVGNTLLQLRVPQRFLGRVTSIWYIGGSLMFVGALPLALLGEVIGLRGAMALAATLFLAVSLWYVAVDPVLKRWDPEGETQ